MHRQRSDLLYDALVCIKNGDPWSGYAAPRNIAEAALAQRPKRQIERFDCADPTDCLCCGEDDPVDECPNSPRECGHHCGHIWTHDSCCWCEAEAGESA